MTIKQRISTAWNSLLGKKAPKQVDDNSTQSGSYSAPINGGSLRSFTIGGDKVVHPSFALEWIKILRWATVFDRHISKATNNFIALAHTECVLELPDDLSKLKRRKVIELWNIFKKDVKLDAYIPNALYTTVYSGALATDCVLSANPYPTGVKRIRRLNGEHILFHYNDKKHDYEALVKDEFSGMHIATNPETFSYTPLKSFEDNPYGIPVFLAAIEDLETHREMIKSFNTIIKKIGMMGFLQVMVSKLQRGKNETDESYYQRTENYLNQLAPQIEKGYNNSMIIGIKDTHEFEFNASSINFTGAKEALSIVHQMLWNGLNTDGVFMNDNQNVTETFARVLLQILVNNVSGFQRAVATSIEKAFMLHCKLKGLPLDFTKVVFEKPLIGDAYKEEQTFGLKIKNALSLVNAGIITNDQAAEYLGYEEATGTPQNLKEPNANPADPEDNQRTAPDNERETALSFQAQTDFKDAWLTERASNYFKSVRKQFKKSAKELSDILVESLEDRNTISEQQLLNEFWATVALDWNRIFTDKITETIEGYVGAVYERFRFDKTIFPNKAKTENSVSYEDFPPDAILDFLDIRLIEYLVGSDTFYLGKFITNDNARAALSEAIKDWYVANEGEIGNSATLASFASMVQEELDLQTYQIRRIIDTTMTNARNFGNINYLRQADVASFRRVEIGDNRTCPHCQAADGMIFEVKKELSKIETFVSSSPEDIVNISPFATTIDINNFKNLSASEMQNLGIGAQALHPHCRGRIVANI